MNCPRCASSNVNVMIEQVGGKQKEKHMGCLFGIFRLFMIVCTCGLWLLLGKKKSTSKISYSNKTVAVCQNCGNKWYIN